MTSKTKQPSTTTANGHVSNEELVESRPAPIALPERTEKRLLDTVEAIARLERERNTIIEVAMDALSVPEGWQLQRMADGALAFVGE